MARDRDVSAFDERAAEYEGGWLGRWHHGIADHVAELAIDYAIDSANILDVGCGTGYLLRRLASQLPSAVRVVGVDPSPGMIQTAVSATDDSRLRFAIGFAEHLPFAASSFDLVIATTSFDHWSDQKAGLAECARVLKPGGQLLLCDQFSTWLVPTLIGTRKRKARTKRRVTALLASAAFGDLHWDGPSSLLIRTAAAKTRTRL